MSRPDPGRSTTVPAPDGARLGARVWRPGSDCADVSGPPPRSSVLVVHGLGEHSGRYGRLARRLGDAGFGVLAYDQRGHGVSEGRRGHVASFDLFLDDFGAALDTLARELPADGPPFVIAHSLGALVALRYLQRRRPSLSGAVLSAVWLDTKVEIPLWKRLASRALLHLAPGFTLPNEVRPERLTSDPVEQRAYVEDPLVHHRISSGFFAEVGEAQAAARAAAPAPGIPLLFLVPTDDHVTDQEAVLECVAGLAGPVRAVRLEGRRHEPLNDVGRTAVVDFVVRWLTEPARREPAVEDRVSSLPPDVASTPGASGTLHQGRAEHE